ncbi:MAG: SMP-30/gluconolactonase/LRE family protein [Sedimentisphaerales bacterium]|nr:SMP-30/gluconolactonase/LRE family protein [Sedimentisphaerales bacterium]
MGQGMSSTAIYPIGNPPCDLAECPLWNAQEQKLYWTDIPKRTLWKYDPQTRHSQIEWQGDRIVGGFAFTRNNNIVFCTDRDVVLLHRDANRQQMEILFEISLAEDERFNDIITDPDGRIFAGTLTGRRTNGVLWRLEQDKEPVAVLHNLRTSNGMAFSPEGRYFYHTDSRPRTITRYDYDRDSGQIANPQLFYEGSPEDGSPDGITMDADGYVWVACYRGGKVLRLNPAGKSEREIRMPTANISSLTFGGPDLTDLYVTSAKADNSDPSDLGGQIFQIPVSIHGRPEYLAVL